MGNVTKKVVKKAVAAKPVGKPSAEPEAKTWAPRIDVMLDRYRKKVGPEGVKRAEQIVAKIDHDIICLAYRMIPRSNYSRLSKRDEQTYASIAKSVSQEAADKWKSDRLAEKRKARIGE